KPGVAPAPRALRLPQDRAALESVRTDDFVHDVAAVATLWDRFDQVRREGCTQHGFEFQFEDLALELLRRLFAFAAQLLDLFLHVRDDFFLLRKLQQVALLFFLLGCFANAKAFRLETAFNLQFQALFFRFEGAPLFAQGKFGVLCLSKPALFFSQFLLDSREAVRVSSRSFLLGSLG